MHEITFTTNGVLAWLAEHPQALRSKKLRTLARAAHKRALTEFATMEQAPGLRDRFKSDAFSRYDFTERGKNYQKWQMRVFNAVLPYRSPKHKDIHMADLLKVPEAGFRITSRNGGDSVVSVLYLPGARILNRIAEPFGEIYRSEFLSLTSSGGRASASWVRKRAAELYLALIAQDIQGTRQRRTKIQ